MANERLDLIVFGATGFTGKCVVQELYNITKNYEREIRWGIAGRNRIKLQQILYELQINSEENIPSKVEIIVADTSDEESLKQMCLRCKVVLNCCGPYRFYGEAVVKACVDNGAHHIDVSGEPAYMEKMQLNYDKAAKTAGVYVISACGFDSIPADLGVVFLQNNFDGEVNSVEAFMNFSTPEDKGKGNVMFNYATWVSLIHSFGELDDLKRVRKSLFPNKIPHGKPELKAKSAHKNEEDKKWYIPLPGADRAVVNRTQRYLHSVTNKLPVQFNVYACLPSLYYVVLAAVSGVLLSHLTKFQIGRSMLLKYPQIFSFGLVSREGPSEDSMKNLNFLVRLHGVGRSQDNKDDKQNNRKIIVEITGTNPMYGATAIASIYCALTVLKEQDKMPETGGVLTPGAAFANTSLIEKLTKHCMNFNVVENKIIQSKL